MPKNQYINFFAKIHILTDRKIKVSLPSLKQINYNTVTMNPEFFFLFQFQILTATFMTMIFLPMDLFISGVFTSTLKLQGQFLGASYRHENAFNYFAAKISISFRTHPISMEYPVESRTRSLFYLHLDYNVFCHRILLRQIKEVSHVFLRTISLGCDTQT